ncbi:hypothetical protein [Limnofasciculus baicalensis]|uniref:Uncharacterized protein n=1 Tax=Limnofasciculus baicalensis BBK-W-15 TaxID=2699891 RepID=A0AAE3GW59_9CYAN|nr:hypothetical protein [Limnofasciculus baicalensis]MCP2731825.1 hypothetical protein [Limnofasciculus baicalensis BBK-W-15]
MLQPSTFILHPSSLNFLVNFGLKELLVNNETQPVKTQSNPNPAQKATISVEARMSRLEAIVGQIGQAVLTTTETVERLATRIDALAVSVQHQGQQVQQQGYQLFALSDAVQTLAERQNESLENLGELIETLQRIATALEAKQK